MATENCWRARKIQAELMKLGIRVSVATISRYLPNQERDPTQQQRWMTFLRNHKDVIAGMDLSFPPFDSVCSTCGLPSTTVDAKLCTSTSPRTQLLAG